jgi:hypothetical protein
MYGHIWSQLCHPGPSWSHFVDLVTSNHNFVTLAPWHQLVSFCRLGHLQSQFCYPSTSWSHFINMVTYNHNLVTLAPAGLISSTWLHLTTILSPWQKLITLCRLGHIQSQFCHPEKIGKIKRKKQPETQTFNKVKTQAVQNWIKTLKNSRTKPNVKKHKIKTNKTKKTEKTNWRDLSVPRPDATKLQTLLWNLADLAS